MSLAVILVNWRNEKETAACARAVRGWQALAPRVLVVDNQSTPATRQALEPAADVLISTPVNLGYAGGNNIGIKHSLSAGIKYILLLNSDAEISEHGVHRMIETLEGNPTIFILGPVIYEKRNGRMQHLLGGRNIARYLSTRIPAQGCNLRDIPGFPLHHVDYISGTVLLARSKVFEEIGFLDEEYFFSGEIADFCKRARDAGHGVCVDLETEARHNVDIVSSRLRETLHAYYTLRNRMLYVKKHHASQRLSYYSLWTMLGGCQIANALRQGNLPKARAIVLALADAYAGRYGDQNARFI